MNCPNCLSLMYNKDEIVKDGDYFRMNLHCNEKCSFIKDYTPFMQVLMKENETWIANRYGLVVEDYLIEGSKSDNYTTISEFKDNFYIMVDWYKGYLTSPRYPEISYYVSRKPKLTFEFYDISTGNDLHIKARELIDNMLLLS